MKRFRGLLKHMRWWRRQGWQSKQHKIRRSWRVNHCKCRPISICQLNYQHEVKKPCIVRWYWVMVQLQNFNMWKPYPTPQTSSLLTLIQINTKTKSFETSIPADTLIPMKSSSNSSQNRFICNQLYHMAYAIRILSYSKAKSTVQWVSQKQQNI